MAASTTGRPFTRARRPVKSSRWPAPRWVRATYSVGSTPQCTIGTRLQRSTGVQMSTWLRQK
jgi:hypothetical protein